MAEVLGWQALLTIAGTLCEFISTDLNESIEIVEDEGIRGTRTHAMERVAQGNKIVKGSITFEPTPVEMAAILQYATNSSSSTTLTDAMQDVTIVLDLRTTKKYTFNNCRFNMITITGGPGKKITVKVDVVGKSCTVASSSLTGVPDITVRPYMYYDAGSGITIGGQTYLIDEFELVIDNKIEPTFMVGQTATDLEPTDREVSLSIRSRYNSAEDALLVLAQAGPVIASPLTGSIAFTNGSNSMTFTFGALVAQSKTVVVPNKKALRLPLKYRCYGVSTTKEVVSTLV